MLLLFAGIANSTGIATNSGHGIAIGTAIGKAHRDGIGIGTGIANSRSLIKPQYCEIELNEL